jgi:anhydro-N-acetylmuramic acid kinase
MLKKTGAPMDKDGRTAMSGTVDTVRVKDWMKHPFFSAPAPKSLDRNAFIACTVDDMSLEDGAATLAAFTVASVLVALAKMPAKTRQVIVAGGGRHNSALMQGLGNHMAVINADQLGWSGDHLEAEGFAYLAARSLNGLPTSLPTTTGCKTPTIGGRFTRSRK